MRKYSESAQVVKSNPEMSSVAKVADETVASFLERLSVEERLLIILKKELYQSQWEELIADLLGRLNGTPYILKLADRIEDDLERVEKLRSFEQIHGVDLGDYIHLDS